MVWDWAVERPEPRLCSPSTRSLSARAGGPFPPPEVRAEKPLDEPPDATAVVFGPGLAGSVAERGAGRCYLAAESEAP